ncbi:MAG: hypothetical protein ACJ8C4_17740 [Gemmataceae bacterium]
MINKGRMALAVAIVGCSLTGCQTHIAGMTLPSGYYMDHRPQYFPQEPSYPLPKELATMQAQSAAAAEAQAIDAGRLPPPAVAPR